MNRVIYKGLVLKSECCRYFLVKEGEIPSIVEDRQRSTLTITYPKGISSKALGDLLGLDVTDDIELSPTFSPKKFHPVYLTLNGMKLEKLTSDSHIFNLIIVSDSESRVVQDYWKTIIVISKEDYEDQDFINYLFYSGNLRYLSPIGVKNPCYEVRNFPKITIRDRDLVLESKSTIPYALRRKYDDYVIRSIDYQDRFIDDLREILSRYGVELVRQNKEETLKITSYVTYQVSQTPIKTNHPKSSDLEDKILQHKVPIDFSFRTTNMLLYYDFKNKYNNVDLLTNYCNFKVQDKYGELWDCAVKWGSISEEFNHTYQLDDNSNFSFQCQFRCELYFNEVIDDRYNFLQEIVYALEEHGNV